MAWFVLLCFSLMLNEAFGQTLNETDPVGLDGANPLVSAVGDTKNVNIFCEVVLGGSLLRTQWTIITEADPVGTILIFNDGIGPENFMSSPNIDFRRSLTILTFNRSVDNTQIGCGNSGTILVRFDLRIIRLPVLLRESAAQIVSEGDMLTFNIQTTPGFPVLPDSFQWSFNGDTLQDSSNPTTSNYPNITFSSVDRNDSGNYSITVTNEAGTALGFFILDVQYNPEGVAQNGPFYVEVGDNITIIGFTNIAGNPQPSSVWSFNGSDVSDNRFNMLVPGQLTISSVILSDAGNYTNTLMNTVAGNLMSIYNTVELNVAEPPSMPRNVSVIGIGAEYVNISWMDPINIGTPAFSQFKIVAVSSINIVNVTIIATNNHIVQGLKPNTEYSLTIRALSTVEQLGVLVSEPSEAVLFNTTLGAPSIRTALLKNTDGNLSVSWEFLHTGGSGLETVTVQCSEEGDEDNVDGASADPLAAILYCSATVGCVMGSVSVGPVTAGGNYSCLVTAENSIGRDEMRTDYIIATTGIPSVPEIISVSGGAGFATITLRVDNFGVLVAADFTFIVSVFSPSDTNSPVAVRMITPDSVDTPMVTIVVDLPEGTYVFSVVSSNSFSPPSDPSSISGSAVVQQRPSTTTTVSTTTTPTTMTSSTSSTSSTGVGTEPTGSVGSSSALSGGAIAGIVIAIIILIAIVAIVAFIVFYIVYQNRGNKEVKYSLSNRNLSVLPSADYEIVDKVYDQPDHLQNIDVEQNIAYGNKDSLSNRNLSFLHSADYEIIDKMFDQPDHLQNMDVEQNVAYVCSQLLYILNTINIF